MSGIFISHTHSDQPIADTLTNLVDELFEKRDSPWHLRCTRNPKRIEDRQFRI